jgi:exonuclease III
MRILTWNCGGALRKKIDRLDELQPDIVIVQECEDPQINTNRNYKNWANKYLWIGDNKNKGLGIFIFNDIQLEFLPWNNIYNNLPVKYFLPCKIDNKFNLLAVWNHFNNSKAFGYIGQFWKYLQINRNKFTNILISGDFNSNSIWDEPDRWWNHGDVVKELQALEIESIYHQLYSKNHGEEEDYTFYLYKRLEKKYHIDYSFISTKLYSHVKKFKIGEYQKWIDLSDHVPIIIDLDV